MTWRFYYLKNRFFYPASYRRPYEIDEIDNANVLLRSEVLSRINSQIESFIIITYNDAIFEKYYRKARFKKHIND